MTSREIWVGTSWKMNKTISEARAYADRLTTVTLPPLVRLFVLPPHTALAAVRDRLGPRSRVLLGAQNAHWGPEGAGTGEISMRMVHDAGAQLVEMGHSERRAEFGETDETVARKARAALDQGMTPLICVGEPHDVRSAGQAETFVRDQVRAALSLVRPEETPQVLVAYEPVWAIGAGGEPATRAEVAPVMAAIAADLAEVGGCRALLYGGGVDLDNARDLLLDPNTQGLFVGRAAWSAGGLLALAQIASDLAVVRGGSASA
jgi:L-erythrulose 1-phosphate isomerase